MRHLNIRWKFILTSFGVMLTTVLIVSMASTIFLKKNLDDDVAEFRRLETDNAKQSLKGYVEIALIIIDKARAAADRGELALEEAKKRAVTQIEQLRWDEGTGYIWINDTTRPIPRMIMHPTLPELNGKILDDPRFNCALGKQANLFVAMVDVSSEGGDGYVDYLWPKPTKDGLTSDQPKLSYVKRYDPFGWIVGTGKYIDDIDAVVAVKKERAADTISGLMLATSLISVFVIVLAFFPLLYAAKRIVTPIIACIDFAGKVERGNLSGFIDTRQQDETGALAGALNSMVNTMRQLLSDVSQHSSVVLFASNKLAATSDKMSITTKQVSEQTDSVAAAAEQVSATIASVSDTVASMAQRGRNIAGNTTEMADSVNSVASSVEEMSQSIHNMAKHCADAQVAAQRNLDNSEQAAVQVKELSQSAQNIGEVVSLIEEITDQTKLLALNATIEAARAGEAGRGFSIVAKEVKELAGQTAKATKAISERIREVQAKTQTVVRMIQDMTIQNQELNEINTSIAAAVEEQSATTADIARTIAGTAQGSQRVSREVQEMTDTLQQEINANIRDAALGVSEVSANIQQVNTGVRKNATAIVGNVAFSRELAQLASELRESISRFNLGYRKFDIGMIKAAHIAWKLHLEAMLQQGRALTLAEIPDHTQCDFGKWLASPEAQELKKLAPYPEMIQHHEQVHVLAYRIAELYHNGQQEKAAEVLEQFKKTSRELFASLDKLYTG
ncbi:MAG: methyl-accepting chemotaxis protein [Desulfobulbaceae bacterium]